ncbi:MAG: hypothetical protein EHM12_04565 [Dehalococcoidia bacterium]|nr:MAG: hypothetical protein EHM12_04565 [Dehalococcoidia bacterium]
MEKDLRLALFNKEKAELFLSNLEKLRSENSVNEMSYHALKTEYSGILQHTLIKIEHIKAEFGKTLAGKNRELEVYKQESANLEARFKVGQIAAASYLKMAKIPEKKLAVLQGQIDHLTSLINARHSAEVTVPEASGFASLLRLAQDRTSAKHPAKHTPPIVNQEPPTQPPPPPPPPQLVVEPVKVPDPTSVSSLMILPDRAFPGSTIGVIATIINTGLDPLQHRAELKVNARVEAFNDVNLNPGQSEEITFMTVAGTPGDYYISVDNAQGILRVLPPQ